MVSSPQPGVHVLFTQMHAFADPGNENAQFPAQVSLTTPPQQGVGGDSFPSQSGALLPHTEEWGGTPLPRPVAR